MENSPIVAAIFFVIAMKNQIRVTTDKTAVRIMVGKRTLEEMVQDQSGMCQVGSAAIVKIVDFDQFMGAMIASLTDEDDKGESIMDRAIAEAVLQVINYSDSVLVLDDGEPEDLVEAFERGGICGESY